MTKTQKENLLTEDEAKSLLKEAIGSQSLRGWASEHDIDAGYVCGARNGTKDMGEAIVKAIGLKRVTMYQRRARSQ